MKDKIKLLAYATIIGVTAYLAGRDGGRKSAEVELARNRGCVENLVYAQEKLSNAQSDLNICEFNQNQSVEYMADSAVYVINSSRNIEDPNSFMNVPDGSTLAHLIWISQNGGDAGKRGNGVVVTMPDGNYKFPSETYTAGELTFPKLLDVVIDNSMYMRDEELFEGYLIVDN